MWKMFIELMQDADKNEILSYMLPYEKFSVTLYSEILHGGKSIYVLRGNFGEIHGIFSWWQGSSIHHCLPEVYGKNQSEIESAFVKFFEENSIKYIFSISGEKSGTLMLKKILENSFEKTPKVQIEYFLMENGRFDSAKDLARMNRQLSVEKCGEQEISRVFPLQVEFEKEEVVFEPELFNEDHCLAKFENFVDAGAVFVGKIKNAPLCKLTVSAQGKNYVLLGGVFTVPKYRNCGLAKALLNSVSQKFAAQSKKCTLFVKTENKAAIKVYEKTGFKKFCNFEILYY